MAYRGRTTPCLLSVDQSVAVVRPVSVLSQVRHQGEASFLHSVYVGFQLLGFGIAVLFRHVRFCTITTCAGQAKNNMNPNKAHLSDAEFFKLSPRYPPDHIPDVVRHQQ